jgi:N-acetyl-alpha-D-glucosaminyl L-malate synthase BshA
MDRSYLPITRFGIEQSDGVTAISQYLRDMTLTDFSISRPIEAIPNFVNCDVYVPMDEAKRAAGRSAWAAPGEKVLFHLSNFRPVKRVTDCVQIFARVAKEIAAHLVLVGDGPDRSQAEMLAATLGIQERVHFLGKQDSVTELLPLADLMLMPSELESFGLAALEAMACRVPAIATRVGGVPELIEDGVTGCLLPVGDVDAMAQAAIRLLRDDAKLERMRAAARQTAQDRFCASRIIPLYEKYYEQVLAQPAR